MNSATHLVEVDLLREGAPLPLLGSVEPTHYRILISRANTRPLADLYPFSLTEPIPSVPIPFQPGDTEPVIDFQVLLQDVYNRSGYDYFIDYHSDPLPPLSAEDLEWVAAILQQQNLR